MTLTSRVLHTVSKNDHKIMTLTSVFGICFLSYHEIMTLSSVTSLD